MLTDDTKVALLLCGKFGGDHKPLTVAQYNKLGRWLVANQMRPAHLLQFDDWQRIEQTTKLDATRLKALMARSTQMALAVEKWQRQGVWILSRSDSNYPERLKHQLKDKAPVLLYGIGEANWLNAGGLGFVGSRDVDDAGQTFSAHQAGNCAKAGICVISGAARGVDKIAMLSALEVGGLVIGIVSELLLKQAVSRDFRHYIANGQLVVISPFEPDARFTVANAMGRNKLIYALADATLVVSAEQESGGTWAGASEALKFNYGNQVLVRIDEHSPQGNHGLLSLGASAWSLVESVEQLQKLVNDGFVNENAANQPNSQSQNLSLFCTNESVSGKQNDVSQLTIEVNNLIYQSVLPILLDQLDVEQDINKLSQKLKVTIEQLQYWLNSAVAEGVVNVDNSAQFYCVVRDYKQRAM